MQRSRILLAIASLSLCKRTQASRSRLSGERIDPAQEAKIDWRFLPSYPQHYVTNELSPKERIVVDGTLDDAAWEGVSWTDGFVDITRHANATMNQVPSQLQTRVKMRWDERYLYVGVELHEPLVHATVLGHNLDVPYHDNDFEVFIDVSGTTQYYKEYEMNAFNATYDVVWGVPDGAQLLCDESDKRTRPYLPVCTNTSFPGYPGNWTMATASLGDVEGGGLIAGTSFDNDTFGRFVSPYTVWTAEIAFPIHHSPRDAPHQHGGLLDTESGSYLGTAGTDYALFDPNKGDAGQGRPRYWHVDFARAEHPRRYSTLDSGDEWCPFNCTPDLVHATPCLDPPSQDECAFVLQTWPTLLGVFPWNCYWEWVWQDVGSDAYMHRPAMWGFVQFAPPGTAADALCGNIEFPGRHLALQLYRAEVAYSAHHNGSYTADLHSLANYCIPPACALADVQYALSAAARDIFELSIDIITNITQLTPTCTSRPCFTLSVHVTPRLPQSINKPPQNTGDHLITPQGNYSYTVAITSNRFITTHHAPGAAPCLPFD